MAATVAEAVRCDVENAADMRAVAELPDLSVDGQHAAQPWLPNLHEIANM
jgi:hypothetical protein